MITKVYYKGKKYNVHNLGEILRDSKGFLIDQLDDESGKSMGFRWKKYLRDKLNLTQEDYYTIVVLGGDVSKFPDCPYEGCNNKVKFGSLGNGSRDKLLCKGCCEKHSRSLAEKENNKIRLENGTHHLLKSNREDHFTKGEEYYSNVASKRALKQVSDGLHPWSGENGSKLFKRRVENGTIFLFTSEYSSNLQKQRLKDGTHQFLDKKVDLKADKSFFLNKGNLTDICYFYIATLKGDDNNIKIGVTEDPEYISHFHHMVEYNSIEIIKSGYREYIAELEYKVKLEFINSSVIGTETFPKGMRDEILKFIDTL